MANALLHMIMRMLHYHADAANLTLRAKDLVEGELCKLRIDIARID